MKRETEFNLWMSLLIIIIFLFLVIIVIGWVLNNRNKITLPPSTISPYLLPCVTNCGENQTCDSLTGLCKAAIGQECKQGSDCAYPAICSGTCALPVTGELNQPCPCSEGHECVTVGKQLTCKLTASLSCFSHHDCASGNCNNDICQNQILLADNCRRNSDCLSNFCSNGFCQKENTVNGVLGAACRCTGEMSCDDGLSCVCHNQLTGICGYRQSGLLNFCDRSHGCLDGLNCHQPFARDNSLCFPSTTILINEQKLTIWLWKYQTTQIDRGNFQGAHNLSWEEVFSIPLEWKIINFLVVNNQCYLLTSHLLFSLSLETKVWSNLLQVQDHESFAWLALYQNQLQITSNQRLLFYNLTREQWSSMENMSNMQQALQTKDKMITLQNGQLFFDQNLYKDQVKTFGYQEKYNYSLLSYLRRNILYFSFFNNLIPVTNSAFLSLEKLNAPIIRYSIQPLFINDPDVTNPDVNFSIPPCYGIIILDSQQVIIFYQRTNFHLPLAHNKEIWSAVSEDNYYLLLN